MTVVIDHAPAVISARQTKAQTPEWWRSAVTYQVYVRSFYDSDGDGNGDLEGVIEKIGYLKDLGVDAIWLTPFFRSPAKDQGYDPASYHKVDPRFGTNEDFRKLIKEAHQHNVRVILDLVVNHTSDQHPWFLHALRPEMHRRRIKSGYDFRIDPFANVYVFRPENPSALAEPPNNWKHFMGDQCAWTKTRSGEWYLHRFTPHQPDLELRNPKVREHFATIIKRWLGDQMVDGIRIDVMDHVFHDSLLRDFDPLPKPAGNSYLDKWDWQARYLIDDEAVQLAGELSDAVKAADNNAVSIAEMHYGERVSDFLHHGRFLKEGRIDVPFNFSLLDTVQKFGALSSEWKRVIDRYLDALPAGGCPNFVLSNHDQTARLIDRVGPANIRAVLMALLCLGDEGGSNIFFYNGDELGMEKGDIIKKSDLNDPVGQLQGINLSRDHVRTGMVWSGQEVNGGFSTSSTPWLPAGQTRSRCGVEEQTADPTSQLNFVKGMIAFRKTNHALMFGKYIPYDTDDEALFCFGRELQGADDQKLLLVCNFSGQAKTVGLPDISGRLLKSTWTGDVAKRPANQLYLQPHEGCILQLVSFSTVQITPELDGVNLVRVKARRH